MRQRDNYDRKVVKTMDFWDTIAGRSFCEGILEALQNISADLDIIVNVIEESKAAKEQEAETPQPIKSEVTILNEVDCEEDIPF